MNKLIIIGVILGIAMPGCQKDEPEAGTLELLRAFAGTMEISLSGDMSAEVPVDRSITLVFSSAVERAAATAAISLQHDDQQVNANITFSSHDKSVVIQPTGPLNNNTVYILTLSGQLKGANGEDFTSMELSFRTVPAKMEITAFEIDGKNIGDSYRVKNVNTDLSMAITFTVPLDASTLQNAATLTGPAAPQLEFALSNDNKTVHISTASPLNYLTKYQFALTDALKGTGGEGFEGTSKEFYTQLDSTYKFPEITDDQLLTLVQEQTFKYFWDFAHPVSGMARERNTSGDVVTTGGSGFGVMAILVGIERGFITRQQGIDRLQTIVNFLASADRFHGAWPHWMNGNTGQVIPFSTKDDGGDLVETAFMIQGLLTVREYLDATNPQEAAIKDTITQLWEEVEWDWYTQDGQSVLYWHWSPNYGWEMNHQIRGWNEALIVYVLAASSPTHSITAEVYDNGWAVNGDIKNGSSFFGITLPLGNGMGGPLFFAHYSFLGLDPRNLEDQYANYWTQNVNHALINRAYCLANPKNYVGYGANSWGLTASDNQDGYSAHSPGNDLGVITPTAAISSIPYTPEYSMDAIRHFYYLLGDKLWGTYGFYDAFNLTEEWTADSYLAIDQGPIIVMIENYRTALLWDLFMSNSEISNGLDKLNFTSY